MPAMIQPKLSFKATKPSATANKSKKAAVTGSKSGEVAKKVPVKVDTISDSSTDEDARAEDDTDGIQVPQTEPETEGDAIDEHSDDKSTKETRRVSRSETGKTPSLGRTSQKAAVKSTVSAKKAPVAEEAPSKTKPAGLDVAGGAGDNESRPSLNVKDTAYSKLYTETREKLGYLPPIHNEDVNRVEQILRTFDMTSDYGPCVGLSRLERWKRAKALNLKPPQEIYDILTTKEGLTMAKYSHDVFTAQI